MVNNYFKVCSASGEFYFPFYDRSVGDLAQAFASARDAAADSSGVASLFRAPLNEGPWDEYPLIGYRNRFSIENDMLDASSEDERAKYIDELAALDFQYRNRPASMKAVA